MNGASCSYSAALDDFASGNERRAEAGFAWLMKRAEAPLHARLRSRLPSHEDRADVIQEVQIKLWNARGSFADRGPVAWWRYVSLTAERCAIDYRRRYGREVPTDVCTLEDIPEDEVKWIQIFLDNAEAWETFYGAADDLWLGPRHPDHSRRLLAAKLLYLDRLPWATACNIVSGGSPGRPRISRSELDAWLSDPAILRHLAYDTLYLGNDRLTLHLLGFPAESPSPLDALLQNATRPEPAGDPPGGWTWPEVAAIIWRYRYSLLLEGILRQPACKLGRESLEELFVKCRARFPFVPLVVDLQRGIGGTPCGQKVLQEPRLWQRLAFQYRYADELPHRDIHERIASASAAAGYTVTTDMLTAWLSAGRLTKRLLQHIEAQGGISL